MSGRAGVGAHAVTSERARGNEQASMRRARAWGARRWVTGVQRVHCSPESTVSAREQEEEDERIGARGGCPWVLRPKRRNREKALVSIGRAFEVHGSN
ncbi:hypothetical protein CRG98_034588 [Punica granatum]|uniref:Uncharacterized protein n=1 Tax=Punica granatum TaxID=22663 RepID=A0A2I0INP4_PUNGR|nr:hypothetical protein CRG98_034588 [Punica granatum]